MQAKETAEAIKIYARAKINLSLDVVGKRADGYHELQMIMQQVDLYDEVDIRKTESGISLRTDCDFVPDDDRNIAYQAARLLIERYRLNGGVAIDIKKNIPVAAGLAGGSADAAAVLQGMNRLWKLELSQQELMQIGLELGTDVPFCILGGAALAEGIGEKLTPIQGIDHWVLLCKPNIGVSTKEVYRNLDWEAIQEHPDTPRLLKAVEEGNIYEVAGGLCNVLETVTMRMHPIVKDIKTKMMEYGALGSLMSGSGPTVFGLYKDYTKAKSAYLKLRRIYKQTYLVKTYNGRERA